MRNYQVECWDCGFTFTAAKANIQVTLEEWYTDDDRVMNHVYLTHCPNCNDIQRVDILDENYHCCLEEQ